MKMDVFICCPECKSELKVSVLKERTSIPELAEYKISTNITTIKQGTLFKGLTKKEKVEKIA